MPKVSQTMVNENNGTGWTDGIISQINLVNGDYYKFEAVWHNDSDGMEQFWIIPGTGAKPFTGTRGSLERAKEKNQIKGSKNLYAEI